MFLRHCYNYLISYATTQCCMLLISLPLLVQWGMGISLASFIGNLLFLPFLMLFLLIASLIFMTEMSIGSIDFLYSSLNILVDYWYWFLEQGSLSWSCAFIKPPLFFLWVLPLMTLYLLLTRRLSIYKKLLVMISLFVLQLTGITIYTKNRQTVPFSHTFDEQLLCSWEPGTGLIINERTKNKNFTKKKFSEKKMYYDFLPFIRLLFGTHTIKKLYLSLTKDNLSFLKTISKYLFIQEVILLTKKSENKKSKNQLQGFRDWCSKNDLSCSIRPENSGQLP